MTKQKLIPGNKHGDILYAIDNVSLSTFKKRNTGCNAYYAATKQLYDQNKRHPPAMIERVPVDSSLIDGYKSSLIEHFSTTKSAQGLSLKNEMTDTLIIPDILFRFNSSKIKPALMSKLQSLVTNLRIRHFAFIEVTGHTDNVGTAVFNQILSLQRAKAIQQCILSNLKLPASTVKIFGAGALMPVGNNETPAGRSKNRRVEIVLKNYQSK